MSTITSAVDVQTWEWIDADGTAHAFSGVNGIVPGRSQGTGMPPVRRADIRVPGRAGAVNLDRTYGERSWALAVTLATDGATTLEEAIAAWARRFNVLRGPGRIRRTRNDGTTRRVLYCDYDDGFGIDQAQGIWNAGAQGAVLMFFAADPFWYDDADTVVPFTTGGVGLGFFPIPNPTTGSFITLASSEVFGSVTVDNDGDVPVFPVWTIEGPGGSIALENLTTGETLAFSADGGLTLSAGQTLTVDTRPGETLLSVDGVNAAHYLSDASTLWPIVAGSNLLQVAMTGATGASSVELSYRRGWLTP
jgi:hypothetical protein